MCESGRNGCSEMTQSGPPCRVAGNPGEETAALGQEPALQSLPFSCLPFPSSGPWTERRGEDGSVRFPRVRQGCVTARGCGAEGPPGAARLPSGPLHGK